MLTRFKVDGFKNLIGVDLPLGPFTCIAGANGEGKSNLFDAISFLSALADKPLMDAALSVRGEGGRSEDVRSLFHRVAEHSATRMSFEVEMLVPPEGTDDLGQEARATMTFLSYQLELELTPTGLAIRKENLRHITKGKARAHLPFPHRPAWRNTVVIGRRSSAFISTEEKEGKTYVKLHQDGGPGRTRLHSAERLPRTVLSSATNAAESRTAVLARREMQSWRRLQLEPSALRSPDPYNAPRSMEVSGAHLPATLARLAGWNRARLVQSGPDQNTAGKDHSEAVYAQIANRLAELIDDVHSIRIEADDSREILKLMLRDRYGTEHEAKSLSDGTLRFLALAIYEQDPSASGVLCLEEPENGMHPDRIPAILRLLRDLAADTSEPAGDDNPLRQVIINTHSPAVVAQVEADDLLLAVPEITMREGFRCVKPVFRWLNDTWRAEARPNVVSFAPGQVAAYLNPIRPLGEEQRTTARSKRVVDRPEIQRLLFSP